MRASFLNWTAPSGQDTGNAAPEKCLCLAAEPAVSAPHFAKTDFNCDRPRGLIDLLFRRFDEGRFTARRTKLDKVASSPRRSSRLDDAAASHADGILYLPHEARFDYLLNCPEAENIGAKVIAAVSARLR